MIKNGISDLKKKRQLSNKLLDKCYASSGGEKRFAPGFSLHKYFIHPSYELSAGSEAVLWSCELIWPECVMQEHFAACF